jgi:TIR domain
MREHMREYKLSQDIERYLATVAKLYAQSGNRQLQELIVNAQARVHEAWSSDNWNGGTYGHALYLLIPETLYLNCIEHKVEIQDKLRDDLNKVHNVQNEFIEAVFLEMDEPEEHEWRKESGLLVAGKRVISADATRRIWGQDGFRVFLSHKSDVNQEIAELKNELRLFGVSCFVAHEDIHPTKAWQDEIENALGSMDAFVALMTPNFHESEWTDQEVGFAFGRGVPIIAVRLGKDPYGFIGKFQALTCKWETAAVDIMKILIKDDRMFSSYVQSLRNCPNFSGGNILAKVLPSIENLSTAQIDEIVSVYNDTDELQGSFGFNGLRSSMYGNGIVSHLNRLDSTHQFRFSKARLVETVT